MEIETLGRLHSERAELSDRITRLSNFLAGPITGATLNPLEKHVMREQLEAMRQYHAALDARVLYHEND